jgi:ABC-type nitrate/sulfonate/bicarbonate transport system permease component
VAIVVLVTAWESFVRAADVPRGLLPAPSEIAWSLVVDAGTFLSNLVTTLMEVVLGFLAAMALGLAIGIGVVRSRWFEAAVFPLVVASQVVPVFAIAPLLVIWLGFGLQSKVFVVALGAFFPFTVNFVAGARAIDPGFVALMRSYSASGRRIMRDVTLPGSVPYLVPAAELAMTYAVIGAVVAEWIGSERGLGKMMVVANSVGRTHELFAAITVTTLMALSLFGLVRIVGRRLTRWDAAPSR